MRMIAGVLVLALGACGAERQPQDQSVSAPPAAAAAEIPAAANAVRAQTSPLMAIPDDPQALKRLEAMGYTIHAEQGHLHAPGVTSCPQMGDGPVM